MRWTVSTLTASLLGTMWITVAAAQLPRSVSPSAVQITLTEAIEQALARNRDLTVSRRDIEISHGKLRQARRYPFNPELGIEGEAGRGVGREEPDRRGVGGGKLGLSQVLEIRGQRGIRVRGAGADLARAEWATQDAEREVIAETTKTFGELLVAHERLALAREALALATSLRDTARSLVDAGSVPEVDLLRTEVEVRRATNRVTLDQASVNTGARALALLVDAPPNVLLRPSGSLLLDAGSALPENPAAFARENRPDVKAAAADVESAMAALRLVSAERFVPSVTLSASYGESVEFDSRTRLALFAVSVPLPLWNRRDGDIQAAEGEIRKREAERDRLFARIDKEVVTAVVQFEAARQVVDEYLKRIVPGQEQNAAIVQEGYRLGEFRLTEALLAQRDLIDARGAYLDAILNYNTARADLQKAIGARP